MTDIIVIGGGGHAKVTISILKKINEFKIFGYTDIKDRGEILGIKYLGDDNVLRRVKRNHPLFSAVIGVGMLKPSDAQKRKRLFDLASSLGIKLLPVLSPNAVINEDVRIGDGTVVMDGVVINSGSIIGEGVILNTNSSVDHDCKIGSFTHIAPGVTLSGGVKVGENVLIGTGAIVTEYKSILDNIIIGAGCVVIHDLEKAGKYVGNPARMIS